MCLENSKGFGDMRMSYMPRQRGQIMNMLKNVVEEIGLIVPTE